MMKTQPISQVQESFSEKMREPNNAVNNILQDVFVTVAIKVELQNWRDFVKKIHINMLDSKNPIATKILTHRDIEIYSTL